MKRFLDDIPGGLRRFGVVWVLTALVLGSFTAAGGMFYAAARVHWLWAVGAVPAASTGVATLLTLYLIDETNERS